MIHLKVRTEFSFRHSAGRYKEVLDKVGHSGVASITDRNSTFGHFKWQTECEKRGIKPIFGVELGVVADSQGRIDRKEKGIENYMTFIAINQVGLYEIYKLVGFATENFYYEPRLDVEHLTTISDHVIVLSGKNPHWKQCAKIKHFYVELNPMMNIRVIEQGIKKRKKFVATVENNYINQEDFSFYQIVVGKTAENNPYPQWILTQSEWEKSTSNLMTEKQIKKAVENTKTIADMIDCKIPKAENVKPIVDLSIESWCKQGAKEKGLSIDSGVYAERYKYELKLIKEKNFVDYFLMVGDLIKWAKEVMAVGCGRGSSGGSLVCYLMGITDIDPIEYNLLFERFISPDRIDPPDIDTDFEDERRELAFLYLKKKYGDDCVAKIGVVSFYKPRSALIDASKLLDIAPWDIAETKDVVIERDFKDERANLCLSDTFEQTNQGRTLVRKFPEIAIAGKMEGHARHYGQHAAGILVTEKPISNYCAIDMQTGAVMMDKYDVEDCGMLKLDALGLRTLAIIRDVLEQKGLNMGWLSQYPTDDREALELLNNKKFAGIFQFEGKALQGVTSRVKIESFNDLIAITALSRPASLQSGGTELWINRKNGVDKVEYSHPMLEVITKNTFGIIVYQEQLLNACRIIGKMGWDEVTSLRKAMGKSMGVEYFAKYQESFVKGAVENGTKKETAIELFHHLRNFGKYAFNLSHSVAYAMVSYQTCVLKAKFPLEFFTATLNHAKDNDQSIAVLREMRKEGIEYSPFDSKVLSIDWTIKNGKIYGGLKNLKGVQQKSANIILNKLKEGGKLTTKQQNLIDNPVTPFDHIYQTAALWGHLLNTPNQYNITSKITPIVDITADKNGTFLILAKTVARTIRDSNESGLVERRGYKMSGRTTFLSLSFADDSGEIRGQINRNDYDRLGKPIIDSDTIGDYYLVKGKVSKGFTFLNIDRIVKITGNEKYAY